MSLFWILQTHLTAVQLVEVARHLTDALDLHILAARLNIERHLVVAELGASARTPDAAFQA